MHAPSLNQSVLWTWPAATVDEVECFKLNNGCSAIAKVDVCKGSVLSMLLRRLPACVASLRTAASPLPSRPVHVFSELPRGEYRPRLSAAVRAALLLPFLRRRIRGLPFLCERRRESPLISPWRERCRHRQVAQLDADEALWKARAQVFAERDVVDIGGCLCGVLASCRGECKEGG